MSEDLEGEQGFHHLKAPNPAFLNNIDHLNNLQYIYSAKA